MNRCILIITQLLLIVGVVHSQDESRKLDIRISSGVSYNGFIAQEPDVFSGFIQYSSYQPLGLYFEGELAYEIRESLSIGLGLRNEYHQRKFGLNRVQNAPSLEIEDFNLRFKGNYIYLLDRKKLNSKIDLDLSMYLLSLSQQSIDVREVNNNPVEIIIRERNASNSNLQEFGFSLGANYSLIQNPYYHLNLSTKINYSASVAIVESLLFGLSLKFVL